jgi:hypothetical protein
MAQAVIGLSPETTGFDPRQVHVRFVADKVDWDRFYSQYFDFPLSVSFHRCSITIHSPPTDAI